MREQASATPSLAREKDAEGGVECKCLGHAKPGTKGRWRADPSFSVGTLGKGASTTRPPARAEGSHDQRVCSGVTDAPSCRGPSCHGQACRALAQPCHPVA